MAANLSISIGIFILIIVIILPVIRQYRWGRLRANNLFFPIMIRTVGSGNFRSGAQALAAFKGYLRHIDERSAVLVCDRPLKRGAELWLEGPRISSREQELGVSALVKWSERLSTNRFQIGVTFVKMDTCQIEIINRYLSDFESKIA